MPRRKTHEEFVNEVFNLVGNEYEVIGTYTGALNKIEMFHVKCGTFYKCQPGNFLFGQRCGKCQGLQKTHEDFMKEVESKFGDTYSILGTYKSNSEKILVRHNECGYQWHVNPNNFLQGKSKCPKCSSRIKYTKETFSNLVDEISNGKFIVTGDYVSRNIKISIKHISCGHERLISLGEIITTKKIPCLVCDDSSSNGEKEISEYLISNAIKYYKQFTFQECKNKKPLPFDFAILDESDNVLCLIEYDGIQHYKPIEWFGGEEILIYTQINDSIKNKYTEENNIPLLRIPYWEFDNLENMLHNFLSNFTLVIQDEVKLDISKVN